MTKFIVVAMVAMVMLISGPISVAHAGGMGIGASPAFICYLIAGSSPGGTIDLTDQFGAHTDLKIGVARMMCTPVITGTGYSLGLEGRNQLPPSDVDAEHLKCYDIHDARPRALVTLEDYFRPTPTIPLEQVTVGVPTLLCTGAIKTIVPPGQ
jgi:hypothetical protein